MRLLVSNPPLVGMTYHMWQRKLARLVTMRIGLSLRALTFCCKVISAHSKWTQSACLHGLEQDSTTLAPMAQNRIRRSRTNSSHTIAWRTKNTCNRTTQTQCMQSVYHGILIEEHISSFCDSALHIHLYPRFYICF